MKTGIAFNLETEIEIRRRANETFEQIIESFSRGLTPDSREDLGALATLLAETREQMRQLEKQESSLKKELRRFFTEGQKILDLPHSVVCLDVCSRSSLDREALEQEMGQSFIERFTKTSYYEKLSVKAK